MAKMGERFLEARGRQPHQGAKGDHKGRNEVKKSSSEEATDKSKATGRVCYNCKKEGHISNEYKFLKKPSNGSAFLGSRAMALVW